jgi:hypothetical protein
VIDVDDLSDSSMINVEDLVVVEVVDVDDD